MCVSKAARLLWLAKIYPDLKVRCPNPIIMSAVDWTNAVDLSVLLGDSLEVTI